MSDDARKNASRLREKLAAEVEEIEGLRRQKILELKQVEEFLQRMDEYENLDVDSGGYPRAQAASGGRRVGRNPPTEEVLTAVERALQEAGKPLRLRELYAAVTSAGLQLTGTDPQAALGATIWRARDKYPNLHGHGYWLAAVPYPPAHYHPRPSDD